MAMLVDQNLPRDLESILGRDFPGTLHVRSLALERAADSVIWTTARARGLAILSKDLDFRHRSAVLGHPPKVILVRRGNYSTREVCALLVGATPVMRTFLADPATSLLAID